MLFLVAQKVEKNCLCYTQDCHAICGLGVKLLLLINIDKYKYTNNYINKRNWRLKNT